MAEYDFDGKKRHIQATLIEGKKEFVIWSKHFVMNTNKNESKCSEIKFPHFDDTSRYEQAPPKSQPALRRFFFANAQES